MFNSRSPSDQNEDRAVSPVIAVALMVGLAVALAGLVGVATTGIVDDLGQDAGGQVSFDQDGDEVDITVQEIDGDVEEIEVRGNIDDTGTFSDTESGAVYSAEGVEEDERITVIADDGAGNEQQIGEYVVGATSS